MTNPNDPAFLTEPKTFYLRQPPLDCDTSYGLTKRELIAAMAFNGLLQRHNAWNLNPTEAANNAVIYADALITELNKGVK